VGNIRALLYTTARNLIIDYYRKRRESSLDAAIEIGFQVSSGDHARIEIESEARIAVDLIHKLDEPHRDVLILRFVEGLRPKDIAEILDESENVVSVRINRAIKKIKKMVQE